MVERHCALAVRIGEGLRAAGYEVLNRVVLNQVLVRAQSDAQTVAIREAAQASGEVWFGPTVWQGRPAFRISVSSWRTQEEHVERLIALLADLRERHAI
jgi:threonine aldolase